jgi:hypothetical protein
MHASITRPNSADQADDQQDQNQQTGSGTSKGDRGGTVQPKS